MAKTHEEQILAAIDRGEEEIFGLTLDVEFHDMLINELQSKRDKGDKKVSKFDLDKARATQNTRREQIAMYQRHTTWLKQKLVQLQEAKVKN